ncbi:MAG: FHA domain-containing protein [Phycisphaeraceae bacterium]
MLILIGVKGPGRGHVFEISRHAPQVLGRQSKSICVPDSAMSRRHAELTFEDGQWFIHDLGSTNGTFVNGKRVEGPTLLNDGDQVHAGMTLLIVGHTEQQVQDPASVGSQADRLVAAFEGVDADHGPEESVGDDLAATIVHPAEASAAHEQMVTSEEMEHLLAEVEAEEAVKAHEADEQYPSGKPTGVEPASKPSEPIESAAVSADESPGESAGDVPPDLESEAVAAVTSESDDEAGVLTEAASQPRPEFPAPTGEAVELPSVVPGAESLPQVESEHDDAMQAKAVVPAGAPVSVATPVVTRGRSRVAWSLMTVMLLVLLGFNVTLYIQLRQAQADQRQMRLLLQEMRSRSAVQGPASDTVAVAPERSAVETSLGQLVDPIGVISLGPIIWKLDPPDDTAMAGFGPTMLDVGESAGAVALSPPSVEQRDSSRQELLTAVVWPDEPPTPPAAAATAARSTTEAAPAEAIVPEPESELSIPSPAAEAAPALRPIEVDLIDEMIGVLSNDEPGEPVAEPPRSDELARISDALHNAGSVAFLIDASGSLVDTLPLVIERVSGLIAELEPAQRFTVIFFQGGKVIEVKPAGLRPATDERKTQVTQWMDPARGRVIPRGAANPVNALRRAIGYAPDHLCICSDNIVGTRAGQVDQAQLLSVLAELNEDKRVRISTIQFFYPDPQNTLRIIAEQHGGVHEFIDAPARTPATGESDGLVVLE